MYWYEPSSSGSPSFVEALPEAGRVTALEVGRRDAATVALPPPADGERPVHRARAAQIVATGPGHGDVVAAASPAGSSTWGATQLGRREVLGEPGERSGRAWRRSRGHRAARDRSVARGSLDAGAAPGRRSSAATSGGATSVARRRRRRGCGRGRPASCAGAGVAGGATPAAVVGRRLGRRHRRRRRRHGRRRRQRRRRREPLLLRSTSASPSSGRAIQATAPIDDDEREDAGDQEATTVRAVPAVIRLGEVRVARRRCRRRDRRSRSATRRREWRRRLCCGLFGLRDLAGLLHSTSSDRRRRTYRRRPLRAVARQSSTPAR